MSIKCENITKRYGTQLALNKVSIEVQPGQITGFLGPNGAGKSTLMKILTGYLQADEGLAFISGIPVVLNKTNFKAEIGYLPESTPLYPEMYVHEYLEMAAGFYQIPNRKKRIAEVIEMTGLTPEAHKKTGALSKGYKQRVGLAQALIHNPKVLILDEPTSGLDPNQLDDIRKLIIDISREKTVLLSTHIMQEVEAICSQVVIINKGNLVATGTTDEIRRLVHKRFQEIEIAFSETVDAKALEALPFVGNVQSEEGARWLITSNTTDDIRPLLFKAAVEKGWTLLTLHERSRSLENIFRELTNSKNNHA